MIRLVDLEKQTHEQCAPQMGISRTTVTEMYESARSKLSSSLVSGKALLIAGGHYRICGGDRPRGCGRNCRWAMQTTWNGKAENGQIVREQIADTAGSGGKCCG